MKKYVLSIDQGTTSSRAILFDHSGSIVGVKQQEISTHYPHTGWVEQDPLNILRSVMVTIHLLLSEYVVRADEIASIGITNQRETTVIWNKKTGLPVYRAVVWQSKQSNDVCRQWIDQGIGDAVKRKTGLIIDSYFSASKIGWILDHVPGARELADEGELLFGTIDTWLIWNLTGGIHVTDYSNASRSMIYNIHELEWDDELLALFHIPRSLLPEVRPSSEVYGHVNINGCSIPIASAIGDQQAALFGQTCFQEGDVKNTYGTGCFLLMNTGERVVHSKHGLLSTIAWGIDGKVEYALEGSVFIAGSAIQWLRDGLQVIESAEHSETAARKVESSEGVYVVPAFVGMGAPYWDMQAKGAMFGLTRGTLKEHIVRATLESLAYQTKDIVIAMEEDSNIALNSLKVDGGATGNDLLLQFQSDILDIPVEKQAIMETTALGAAYLAGLAVKFWDHKEQISRFRTIEKLYTPLMSEGKRAELYSGWKQSVNSTMGWKVRTTNE